MQKLLRPNRGIQLNFRPFISSDGMIRLELRPSVSSVTFQNALTGGANVPLETTQELTTNIRCRDGETIILGGLFRESSTITRNQVPFLGDIPIIGAAFRGQVDAVNKEEIIFLLTTIINFPSYDSLISCIFPVIKLTKTFCPRPFKKE